MFHAIAALLLTLIFGLPVLGLAALARVLPDSALVQGALLVASPVLYALGFVLVAGVASRPFHRWIVPGSYPRDLRLPAYRGRRFYGLCFTAVFYFTPIYWMFLTVPPLKALLFRLFGYRGQMKFTVYPDTWIRDLPILDFGEGAYVANKATLGTNVCLNDGTILVDRITLGKQAMVGHLSMLAPGVVMEERAEIGIGTAIGMKARLGPRVSVGGICTVSHLTQLEEGVSTGTAVDIGAGVRLGAGIHIRPGAFVPNRTRWKTQADADRGLDGVDEGAASPRIAPTRERAAVEPAAPERGEAAPGTPQGPHEGVARAGSTGEFRRSWNAFE